MPASVFTILLRRNDSKVCASLERKTKKGIQEGYWEEGAKKGEEKISGAIPGRKGRLFIYIYIIKGRMKGRGKGRG